MPPVENQQQPLHLCPEKVAYWYFRLNGFLQIENFVVHPPDRGGQRTDADILGVRFPQRAEFRLDYPEAPMQDDVNILGLTGEFIDIVIAEVKTSRPCSLNGPWTNPDDENVQRVLLAIGCLSNDQINDAAQAIYETGIYSCDNGIRVRLVAVGRTWSRGLQESHPDVVQVRWEDILSFVWNRFSVYEQQKRDTQQWDAQGNELKRLAAEQGRENFVRLCFEGLRRGA